MPVQRLNHAVLYVRDVERSREFYESALGFRTLVHLPGQAAFLQAEGSTNDHDLGLFQMGETSSILIAMTALVLLVDAASYVARRVLTR